MIGRFLLISTLVLPSTVACSSSALAPVSAVSSSETVPKQGANEIYQRLLQKRIIFLGREIDSDLATQIIAAMLYLDSQAPGKDIYLYINSPGGSVADGMAIYDTMQSLKSDVVTINAGLSASMAAFLLAAGTKGKRLALPDSRIMIHQPSVGSNVGNVDRDVQTSREILKLKNKLNEIFAQHTGQPIERIERDTQREFFMSAQEAKEYGIIDRVLDKRPSSSSPLPSTR
jgi:ATP-dependent Clp protease, protease subunit